MMWSYVQFHLIGNFPYSTKGSRRRMSRWRGRIRGERPRSTTDPAARRGRATPAVGREAASDDAATHFAASHYAVGAADSRSGLGRRGLRIARRAAVAVAV